MIKNQYTPDFVSPPGETLEELLESIGMTQAELAERTGRPKKTINEIIKGKAAITPETALQFERVLGVPASFWNNREQYYRASLARQADHKSLSSQAAWLKQFPIRAMVKAGWLTEHANEVDQLQALLSFLGIASPSQWRDPISKAATYRRSATQDSNPYALGVWLRKGELEAQQLECVAYSAETFGQALGEIRKLTARPFETVRAIAVHLCAQAGVALVFVPTLPKLPVNGATYWLAGKPVIQVSFRYKSEDQLWFTFFHEAGHILKHGKRNAFIETGSSTAEDTYELEADRFAADQLIPPHKYQAFQPQRGAHFSLEEIVAFASELNIAPGIVVGRLQHDQRTAPNIGNGLKRRLQNAL